MVERLALGIVPGAGWRASEIRSVAQEAEAAGFDAIFSAEVNNDVLATAQLMGEATKTIKGGSWIANIYLRHSYTCARGAALIAEATDRRRMLGLGVSHQPINRALGIDMPSPIDALRQYTTKVSSWLRGEGPATHLPQQPASHPVPIHLGALTSATVELAGELADGVMPFLWSAERIARSKTWIARGRASARTGQARDHAGAADLHRQRRSQPDDRRSRQRGPLRAPALLPASAGGQWLHGGGCKGQAGCGRRGLERCVSRCGFSDRPGVALPRATGGVHGRRSGPADPGAAHRRR